MIANMILALIYCYFKVLGV